jgi:hypothetical protein
MTERAAKALAATLGGEATFPMPSSRSWGVVAERRDGCLAVIEEHAGWTYSDRNAFRSYQRSGDAGSVVEAHEWSEWDGGEQWARGLSAILGSDEYWHSGGGIWLVFYSRPDGKFAVIGAESGGVYPSRIEYEADDFGEKAESHIFV